MTSGGGVLVVYLTLAGTITATAVGLSRNLQELLGPVGRLLARRREAAVQKGLARMAAAAKATGTITDAEKLTRLEADVAWLRGQLADAETRAVDAETEARQARAEVSQVRRDYGREVRELRATVDRLILASGGRV